MRGIQFQSTRPIRGATTSGYLPIEYDDDFNPRAPYGARLDVEDDLVAIVPISIHAPHTGRDKVSVLIQT